MRKWTSVLAAGAAGILFSGTAGVLHAQQRTDVDGCALLTDAVYSELFVSALFGSSRLPPEPAHGDALSCDHTAAAVSAGFSRAMAAINVYVTWSAPAAQSGTICATGDLTICTPLSKPMISGGALDAASVTAMWQVVSGVVSRNMPFGTMGDRSTFREYELRVQLSVALMNRYWDAYGWVQPRSVH